MPINGPDIFKQMRTSHMMGKGLSPAEKKELEELRTRKKNGFQLTPKEEARLQELAGYEAVSNLPKQLAAAKKQTAAAKAEQIKSIFDGAKAHLQNINFPRQQ